MVSGMLRVEIRYGGGQTVVEHGDGPLEIGRGPRREHPRCRILDPCVSKDQIRLEFIPPLSVKLENLSQKVPVLVNDGPRMAAGESRVLLLPAQLTVGETGIELTTLEPQTSISRDKLQTISKPARHAPTSALLPLAVLGGSPSPETLTEWFESVLAVLRAAPNSPEFYKEAARALVEMVGLDVGVVLLRRGEGWNIAAQHSIDPEHQIDVSHTILKFVVDEHRTFYQGLPTGAPSPSLIGVKSVIASPILDDETNEVVGAVYGVRTRGATVALPEIRPLDAQVVQLLAAAVGTGLARMKVEEEAARRHVQFEQFFSPELTRELDRDPSLLEGRERTITVLFSDIRGFSRLAEALTPSETCRFVRDVMEHLSARIRDFDGVVVDYVGDGLLAMWNAPGDQPEHAQLACRAALAIIDELPALSTIWQPVIGSPLGLGIGLNTGPALVGNVGSMQKFKYGPLGHAVNLASRVEGATKQLGVSLLMTRSTRDLIGDGFAVRRLGRVRAVGMNAPTDLFELRSTTVTPEWTEQQRLYETALALFEEQRWADCCQAIYPLLKSTRDDYDIPSLTLVGRAIECLRTRPAEFDPVFDLRSK
jgi:adenylate cyclase